MASAYKSDFCSRPSRLPASEIDNALTSARTERSRLARSRGADEVDAAGGEVEDEGTEIFEEAPVAVAEDCVAEAGGVFGDDAEDESVGELDDRAVDAEVTGDDAGGSECPWTRKLHD